MTNLIKFALWSALVTAPAFYLYLFAVSVGL